MKRNVKRTVAIMATGLFGASLAATTDFAVAQNRINAGPVAQMHGGKAFLKPATSLQGTRSQFQRNEAVKALNPQPLPPHEKRLQQAQDRADKTRSMIGKLQSSQRQINRNIIGNMR